VGKETGLANMLPFYRSKSMEGTLGPIVGRSLPLRPMISDFLKQGWLAVTNGKRGPDPPVHSRKMFYCVRLRHNRVAGSDPQR
jgi:hypothetical protein